MTRSLLHGLLAITLLPALLVAPAAAQGGEGTILYIQDGDVWIAAPDGAGRHQVTEDGGWSSPSMADDGTIVAVKSRRAITRMDAAGTHLSAFEPDLLAPSGISQANVSADGRHVAYETIQVCSDGQGFLVPCPSSVIVDSDGADPSPRADVVGWYDAAWLPTGDVVVVANGTHTFGPGDTSTTFWFRGGDGWEGPERASHVSASRDGGWLAVNGEDGFYEGEEFPGYRSGIGFYRLSGPPPAQPQLQVCGLYVSSPGDTIGEVSMAPSGPDVVYASGSGGADPAGESGTSVFVTRDLDPTTCAGEILEIATDATDPFWSAAPFDPSAVPVDPGPSGEPEGVRLDGGGREDPVGQAIATSRALFADGAADRVVLATADRFPDALAGSGLAGESGPILLTPFDAELDSRVGAEISRVTGGRGVALILGGVAAVSEGAAVQARAAAGSQSCAVPFPADCRYAGSGREDTAALIGASVLAEHGGSRVLLARGDVFADAITGGAYAAEAGVPVLLTPPDQLNGFTRAFVEDNAIAEVVVLGGVAAVDQPTMDAVPAASRRRIEGRDRTETAAAIARQLWVAEGRHGGGSVLVNVRDADGWQTALTGAVYAAVFDAPQLGVENPPAAPTQAALDAARVLGGTVFALGGTDLVSVEQRAAVQAATD